MVVWGSGVLVGPVALVGGACLARLGEGGFGLLVSSSPRRMVKGSARSLRLVSSSLTRDDPNRAMRDDIKGQLWANDRVPGEANHGEVTMPRTERCLSSDATRPQVSGWHPPAMR